MSTFGQFYTITFVVLFLLVVSIGVCKGITWILGKIFDSEEDDYTL